MAELRIPEPSEKQCLFMADKHKYIGYGGARGGGKSWAVRVKAVLLCLRYAGIKVMIIRKTYPELQENHIIPLCEMLGCYADESERIASYNDGKKHIVFPNGSRILFRYCDNDKDALRFQGTEVDVLFVDEATQQSEEKIDMMQTAFVKNTMLGATPRYFQRMDGAINEEEFLNLANPVIHVSGNLGEDSIRTVDYRPLSGNYLEMRTAIINELRETSGNTETSVGLINAGVTAASAIAALQEASGKGSRDATRASYRAYGQIISMCIELIRQFYDLPRQFRITGQLGIEQFVSYSNSGIKPQYQGMIGDTDLGMRLPVFDIKVIPQKKNSYTRLSQNELALQFYQLGFFAEGQADQALACMSMMEFEGKDELMQRLAYNGTMQRELAMYQQYALALTQKYEPDKAGALMESITGRAGGGKRAKRAAKLKGKESGRMERARSNAYNAALPGGGR